MSLIVGVDPGNKGAFSIIDTEEHTVDVFPMPMYGLKKTKKTVYEPDHVGVADILRDKDILAVYVEQVQYIRGDGAQGSFSFGRNYGTILGACGGLQLPVTRVRPAAWKRAMRCPADKDQSRARATELMPACSGLWKLKKDDGLAEASLIALYGLSDMQICLSKPLKPKV